MLWCAYCVIMGHGPQELYAWDLVDDKHIGFCSCTRRCKHGQENEQLVARTPWDPAS